MNAYSMLSSSNFGVWWMAGWRMVYCTIWVMGPLKVLIRPCQLVSSSDRLSHQDVQDTFDSLWTIRRCSCTQTGCKILQCNNGNFFSFTVKFNKPECSYGYRTLLKGKGSPCSITERRVLELIPVLGSQPAGEVSHKPDDYLSLIHIWRCRRLLTCRSRWSPYH